MGGRGRGWRGAVLAVGMLAVAGSPAVAALDFQSRASGHVYQCGPHVVDIPRDGAPTLGGRDRPEVATASRVRWRPHGVKLTFRNPKRKVTLSEYGATVSLVGASEGEAVCVQVR